MLEAFGGDLLGLLIAQAYPMWKHLLPKPKPTPGNPYLTKTQDHFVETKSRNPEAYDTNLDRINLGPGTKDYSNEDWYT